MRILTYAVRKAMAEAAAHQELIPCAPPTTATPKNLKRTSVDHEHTPINKKIRFIPEDVPQEDEEMDYITGDNLPQEMEKYWVQRKRLFSRFDEGIKMDKQSWYSVTPELIAQQIAARSKCKLIVDGFCGAGGNTIQFAMTCDKVIAIDNDPNKIKLAINNARVYGVIDKIQFICTDFLAWMAGLNQTQIDEIETVFLSPPWGGLDYLSSPSPTNNTATSTKKKKRNHYYKLKDLQPINGYDLFQKTRSVTDKIVFFLPRHMDIQDLSRLAEFYPLPDNQNEKNEEGRYVIEVEENWMNQKCKAITVYFGPLVSSSIHP
ncbi:hypothetical protein MJO29_002110 [Puccinia striiformis f. sp. tritici]|nr:hypothetical protein MJO29_002110 [Puccinia striiformis f. sp. tritici]